MTRPTMLLVCLWTLSAAAAQAAAAQAAEPDASIEAGRRALDRGGLYPWYDAMRDDVRPLPAPENDFDDDLDSESESDPTSESGQGSTEESGGPGGSGSDSRSRSGTGSDSDGDSSSRQSTSPPNLPMLPGFQVFAWLLVAAALLAVTYVVVWAFWSLLPGRRAVRDDDSDDEDRLRRRDALPTVARFQAGLLDEARRRYEAGDFDNAIVYLFCHQLVQLDRHDRIRLTRGKTNRQYLRELDPQTDLRKILQQSMSTFEDAFFGHHAIDRTRFEGCWNRLEEFETLAARRAA